MHHSSQRPWAGLASRRAWAGVGVAAFLGLAATSAPPSPNADFGAWVEQQLSAHAEQLFGFRAGIPFDDGLKETIQWFKTESCISPGR